MTAGRQNCDALAGAVEISVD